VGKVFYLLEVQQIHVKDLVFSIYTRGKEVIVLNASEEKTMAVKHNNSKT
jgi:hypothetical protein